MARLRQAAQLIWQCQQPWLLLPGPCPVTHGLNLPVTAKTLCVAPGCRTGGGQRGCRPLLALETTGAELENRCARHAMSTEVDGLLWWAQHGTCLGTHDFLPNFHVFADRWRQ